MNCTVRGCVVYPQSWLTGNPMKRPAAILFDVGDTLLREVSFDLNAGIAALVPSCCPSRERATQLADEVRVLLQGIPPTGESELPIARWLFEQLLPEEGSATRIDEVELQLWQHTVQLVPMPGAAEMLEHLHAQGIAMGAVSNAIFSARIISHELERHDLLRFFRFVISSADVGVRKPDSRIFHHALSLIDVAPEDVWFIGDSWQNDVAGAAVVSMWPVWLNSTGLASASDLSHLHVADWSEFRALWNTLT
jgi:putative hydrolase of the HAD superfamily